LVYVIAWNRLNSPWEKGGGICGMCLVKKAKQRRVTL
jgi:hypothetical protein